MFDINPCISSTKLFVDSISWIVVSILAHKFCYSSKWHLTNQIPIFTFYPSALPSWRGIVVTVGAGGRVSRRPTGQLPDLRNPYLCNSSMGFLYLKFCGIVWACSCVLSWSFAHLPLIWACPWAKNLSNLPQMWSRLCRTHISETAEWIYPI